ncbi:hypothetical protein ACVIIV_003056 [Bradyrhizobium sp. USDA 4354]
MSRTGAFLLGALGGLLPILVTVLAVDLAPFIDHPEVLSVGNYVGYAIRVVVLIFLGGMMALLNNEVKQPFAIVQLGIAAPALVTSFINGATPAKPPAVQHASFSIVSVAYADEVRSAPVKAQLAGFLEDVNKGLTQRLDGVAAQNLQRSQDASQKPPQGLGNACITVMGRIPGPTGPIGGPCTVPAPNGGVTNGYIGQ